MDLALLIFTLVFGTELLQWIGKSIFIDFAFSVYQFFVSGSTLQNQRQLKGDLLKAKLELDGTSSQNEFAKWAKLRRKLDKLVAELEKTNTSLQTSKASFTTLASRALWMFTTGLQFLLVWWYRKQAVFYMPKGWLGPGMGWWFSLPFAPKGAISSAAWSMVCKRSIKAVEEIVRDFLPSSEPEAAPGSNPFAAFGASPMGGSPFAGTPPMMQEEKTPRVARQRAPKPAAPAPDLGPQLDLD